MHVPIKMLCTASAVMLACAPAMAAGTMSGSDNMAGSGGAMGTMSTMKGGEVMAVMPNGQMGTTMMSGDKMESTVGMSSPIEHCMMFITDSSGMVHQVDTSSDTAQKECEDIAK